MIVRHNLPSDKFVKFDRAVFTLHTLSDGATRLYGYLCSLRNGANFSDKYITTALKISQAVLTRRKKELKDHQLIMIDQLTPRIYIIYIGHTRLPASEVKNQWVKEEDAHKKEAK